MASTTSPSISGTSEGGRGAGGGSGSLRPPGGRMGPGGLGAGSPIVVKGKAPPGWGGGLSSRVGFNSAGSIVPSGRDSSGSSEMRSSS